MSERLDRVGILGALQELLHRRVSVEFGSKDSRPLVVARVFGEINLVSQKQIRYEPMRVDDGLTVAIASGDTVVGMVVLAPHAMGEWLNVPQYPAPVLYIDTGVVVLQIYELPDDDGKSS
jgi:hypothetical protein